MSSHGQSALTFRSLGVGLFHFRLKTLTGNSGSSKAQLWVCLRQAHLFRKMENSAPRMLRRPRAFPGTRHSLLTNPRKVSCGKEIADILARQQPHHKHMDRREEWFFVEDVKSKKEQALPILLREERDSGNEPRVRAGGVRGAPEGRRHGLPAVHICASARLPRTPAGRSTHRVIVDAGNQACAAFGSCGTVRWRRVNSKERTNSPRESRWVITQSPSRPFRRMFCALERRRCGRDPAISKSRKSISSHLPLQCVRAALSNALPATAPARWLSTPRKSALGWGDLDCNERNSRSRLKAVGLPSFQCAHRFEIRWRDRRRGAPDAPHF